ncbi:MAG: YegS/Rv2252/BmrU family lipid kinase [bacterium]|nr:YegS/Rv2252/BmrU family lipid kinase [bacterium]MCP4968493.1 YegS/Rv2252/BmrU family lipid kinase [bacterium]
MKWWVIVNPSAGRPKELRQRTDAALSALGVDFDLHVSESPAHVAELVARGRDAGVTSFAGVGGDGTAHLILNGLMQQQWDRPPRLALLPAGSGSDFIRTFALPRRLEDAAAHLATDDWYPTDVLRIEGTFGERYVLNAVEVGVGAAAVTTAARMPRWVGAKRYAIAFWLALPFFRPAQVTARVSERKQVAGTAIAVIVANGQFFGGGMNIAPRASVADGIVDVQVFSGPRRKALTVMPRVIRGMHLRHKNVRRMTAEKVRIEVPDSWPIEADGELLGTGSVSVTVVPAAIEFKI